MRKTKALSSQHIPAFFKTNPSTHTSDKKKTFPHFPFLCLEGLSTPIFQLEQKIKKEVHRFIRVLFCCCCMFAASYTTWRSATSSWGSRVTARWRMAWGSPRPWPAWWTSTITPSIRRIAPSRLKAVRRCVVYLLFFPRLHMPPLFFTLCLSSSLDGCYLHR